MTLLQFKDIVTVLISFFWVIGIAMTGNDLESQLAEYGKLWEKKNFEVAAAFEKLRTNPSDKQLIVTHLKLQGELNDIRLRLDNIRNDITEAARQFALAAEKKILGDIEADTNFMTATPPPCPYCGSPSELAFPRPTRYGREWVFDLACQSEFISCRTRFQVRSPEIPALRAAPKRKQAKKNTLHNITDGQSSSFREIPQ